MKRTRHVARANKRAALSVPCLERPLCEPVDLAPGAMVRVERIVELHAALPSSPFVHFHDVHELVIFGNVAGHFYTESRSYPLSDHAIAFIPSLCQHDFALAAGRRDWVLVQIAAGVSETLARARGLERLREPFCALPGQALRRRLSTLANWLAGLDAADPLALPLAELLLRAVVAAPDVAGEARIAEAGSLRRLRPAIERLRLSPASAPGADEAAALCALSQAYFSRRFKQQVGMSWSDYVRTHRLHLASRRLLETDEGVADIAAALGFATPSHFTALFRRRYGASPRAYRNRAGSTPAPT